jgi:adenylosuccinate synthase
MKRRAVAVIGANLGDEGKGLITDYLARMELQDVLVVRHNGGCQAGHTVVEPDGTRHVHQHFGSGTVAYRPTLLSRFFVCNPMLFCRELDELAVLDLVPKVYVDGDCEVTTPYDMMINQAAEKRRGAARHGSVGVGFGETIERASTFMSLRVSDLLLGRDRIRARLDAIRNVYALDRLRRLGIDPTDAIMDDIRANLEDDNIRERWLQDVSRFIDSVSVVGPWLLSMHSGDVLFEGAQGLMLDEHHEWFPHVTRSRPGLRNVAALCHMANIRKVEPIYVTRCYMTRHGAGPLPNEARELEFAKISDPTNRPNEYQGAMRFAPLDLDLTAGAIRADLATCGTRAVVAEPMLAVTCLDQCPSGVTAISRGNPVRLRTEQVLDELNRKLMWTAWAFTSHGPTCRDVCRASVLAAA